MELAVNDSRRADHLVGTTLAERFELLALAATGGMGCVYRARDHATDQTVAVKVLVSSDGDARRFAREAEALAGIDHPGVVRYLAHGTTSDGAQYLAMEWLSGEDLARRLDEGTLGVEDTLAIARQIADSLAAAHRHGIVHRDLKPANIFLVGGKLDDVRLVDFGIARAATDESLTVTGTFVGTPAYMAPEQVRGGAVDPRVDVYGLGAVIFRCLVGHPPFQGAHQLAVLAKVVLEPPPPIRDLRPDVSASLESLLVRMLEKDPALRPADGGALGEELRALDTAGASSARHIRAAITSREQRVACVVLCASTASGERTVTESASRDSEDVVRRAVEARGGTIAALAKGGWVITIPNAASPTEQATRAARCALALAATMPGAPLFVATGRILVTGEHRVGEVLDRAADALGRARSEGVTEGVLLDVATAELLDGRFRIDGDAEWRELRDEEDSIAPVRMLLGKPTPCVGRETQLAMLTAMVSACAGESHACSALVTAPPGFGKTHVIRELLRTSVAARGDVDVLVAKGDPIRAASPLGVASQLVRRAAGVLESDRAAARAKKLAALVARDFDAADRPRMQELLGEIAGTPTAHAEASAALRAARADVSIMADAVQAAWIEWMAARAERGMLLVLVEDLHWVDAASVRLIEAALGALEERPVFLLATSRPEGSAQLSERFRSGGFVEVTLSPLSTAASERLVRSALGPNADAAMVRALAKRAAGHPFHLEELVRAVANGGSADALPDSVLGMVQARLDELDARARRLLRAASVFGESFWSGGMASMMGDDLPLHELRSVLAELVDREMITEERTSKWLGETEYRFRHGLLRDGAYATLAEPDRVRAHRRAAAWLEGVGESDPAVLAEHYDRGAAAEKALPFFQRAASQALQRNDLDRAMSHTARARALGPDTAVSAALDAIEAEILFWRGDMKAAAERASEALARLPRGEAEWFDAVSVGVGALGQLGRNDAVADLLDDAAQTPSSPKSRGAHVVALARGMTQLFWAHHGGGLASVRACLDSLVDVPEALDPYHAGWVHRVRGESAWLHDRHIERCLAELEASCTAFERARALRALCLTRLNTASLAGWSGAPALGLELLTQSRAQATQLGLGFLLRYGQAVEGLLGAYAGNADAEAKMKAALVAVGASPRLAFLCRVVVGWLALERNDVDVAHVEARAAVDIVVAPELRPAGMALAARVALAKGDAGEAIRLASAAKQLEGECRDLELTFGFADYALAEAQLARGAKDEARATIASITSRLDAIASTIPDAAQRRRFWDRPLANAGIVRLGRELGVG
ncbi:MAG: protein kinase [Labilithrix sp.]|nr:protein kinase [Labilithrix sp.]